MDRTGISNSSPWWQRGGTWSWIVLCLILLFAASIRFRLRDMPLERDEGEFAYGGQLLLQGVPPGELLYTMKLPGTHAAYAVAMSIFGQTCAGVHLGFLIVNGLAIALVFLLARMFVGDLSGCIAAASYALLSLSADVLGTSAHATHFVVLFALGGFWFCGYGARTGNVWNYFVAGFLLGSSVLMKHNGVLFLAFGGLWLVWLACTKKLGANVAFWKAAAMFLVGAGLPMLLLVAVLWRAGTLENYWFWAVSYAGAYAKPFPGVILVWRFITQRIPPILEIPLYVALFSVMPLWLRRNSKSAAFFATGLLLFSLLAVIPGLHLRRHYYVVLMPVVALLIGTLVQQLVELLGRWRLKILAVIPAVLFAVAFVFGVVRERKFFFQMSPVEACRSLYGYQPFPEALAIGEYIRTHSATEARIAVLGSEPEIYFYAQRRSATGYVYTYPLAERQPFAQRMQAEMKREIETIQPQFIVRMRTWTSWLARPTPQKRVDDLCALLAPPHYKLIGACEFLPEEERVVWHWAPASLPSATNVPSELLVYERIEN